MTALDAIARASHTLRDWGLPYADLVAAHEAFAALIDKAKLVVEIVPGDRMEESDAIRALQAELAKVQS